jgi:peptidoglycan/LPS O-acetylase OafA/YrhL
VLGHTFEVLFASNFDAGTTGALHLAGRIMVGTALWSHDAVIVFFVLSGFLVGGPFLLRLHDGRADLPRYAAARLARMYTVLVPALALTLVCDAIALSFFSGQTFVSARPEFFPGRTDLWNFLTPSVGLCNLAFLQTIACKQLGSNLSLWSLSNEGLYYVIWPCLMMSLRGRWAAAWPLIGFAALIALTPALAGDWWRVAAYSVYFGIWSLGALAFAAMIPAWFAAAMGLAGLLSWHFTKNGSFGSDVALSVAFAAGLILIGRSGIGTGFLRRPAHAAAEISFSLYATHLPILVICLCALGRVLPVSLSWGGVLLFIGLVAVTVALAGAFWWLFERHTKWVKDRVERIMMTLVRKVSRPTPLQGGGSLE